MKNIVILLVFLFNSNFFVAQLIQNLDQITPYQEGFAAIKKGDQWAFININGEIVIDFRSDLVSYNLKDKWVESDINLLPYPHFKEGKCLIRIIKDGIYYYGYMDTSGKQVIAPEYVNASDFNNGYALVVKFVKIEVGSNNLLGKPIVAYRLEDHIINALGEPIKHIFNDRTTVPDHVKGNVPTVIESKFVGKNLVAVKNKSQKWDIYEF